MTRYVDIVSLVSISDSIIILLRAALISKIRVFRYQSWKQGDLAAQDVTVQIWTDLSLIDSTVLQIRLSYIQLALNPIEHAFLFN